MSWIALTDPVERAEIWINVDHIQEIRALQAGSVLMLSSGRTRRVAEPLEDLIAMLQALTGE